MNRTTSFFQTTLMSILDEMNEYSWLFSKNPKSDFTIFARKKQGAHKGEAARRIGKKLWKISL